MNRDELLAAVLPANAKQYTRQFIEIAIDKLIELSVLSDSDIGAIRMLSVNYEMYVQASNELIADGPILTDRRGNKKANPANKLVKDYGSQIFVLLKEFGLTVKSRDLIGSMNPDVEETNPIKLLLEKQSERNSL